MSKSTRSLCVDCGAPSHSPRRMPRCLPCARKAYAAQPEASKPCQGPGPCRNKAKVDYCNSHQKQLARTGVMVPLRAAAGERVPPPPCTFDGCDKPQAQLTLGLCTGHLSQRRAGKELTELGIRAPRRTHCDDESGCTKPPRKDGKCYTHMEHPNRKRARGSSEPRKVRAPRARKAASKLPPGWDKLAPKPKAEKPTEGSGNPLGFLGEARDLLPEEIEGMTRACLAHAHRQPFGTRGAVYAELLDMLGLK